MDDELQRAVDELTAAIRGHAEAASQEPETPEEDELQGATHRLLNAIHGYTDQLREATGAWVPWDVPEGFHAPDDEMFADETAVEVIGRWRYVVPSISRLLDYVGNEDDRLDGRPEVAVYELLHAREHPLRWIAEDVIHLDRAQVGIFEATDGEYIDRDLPEALHPETEQLFGYTDHPRFDTEEEALAAARAAAEAINADPDAGTATVREDVDDA